MAIKSIYKPASLIVSAIATLALVSCGGDAVVTHGTESKYEIGFSVREEKTRAGAVTIDELESIGVYGYFTGYERWWWISVNDPSALKADYFCNTMLKKDEGWTYSPLRYWPMEPAKRLSFFAYAPYADGNELNALIPYPLANSETGVPVIKYTVPAKIKDQIDLLWGCVQDKNIENPLVDFTMNHALSALSFSVKYASEEEAQKGYNVNVTGISISGIYGSGILDLGTGTWTFDTDFAPTDAFTVSASETDVIVPEPHLVAETNISVPILTANAGMLMLIPQDLENGAITFFLDFIATDSNRTPVMIPFKLSDTFQSWQAGKHYHYELLVRGDFITVETSVKSIWLKSGNETSGNVIL